MLPLPCVVARKGVPSPRPNGPWQPELVTNVSDVITICGMEPIVPQTSLRSSEEPSRICNSVQERPHLHIYLHIYIISNNTKNVSDRWEAQII